MFTTYFYRSTWLIFGNEYKNHCQLWETLHKYTTLQQSN